MMIYLLVFHKKNPVENSRALSAWYFSKFLVCLRPNEKRNIDASVSDVTISPTNSMLVTMNVFRYGHTYGQPTCVVLFKSQKWKSARDQRRDWKKTIGSIVVLKILTSFRSIGRICRNSYGSKPPALPSHCLIATDEGWWLSVNCDGLVAGPDHDYRSNKNDHPSHQLTRKRGKQTAISPAAPHY